MRCVAAPIMAAQGEVVAGISMSGPTHRFSDEKIKIFVDLVRLGALAVSRSIGAHDGRRRRPLGRASEKRPRVGKRN
ncbi:IclR family transcriptional regulator domain-containing protein [Chenggangzhangella methanolivorans]|nr:IclR family transcriptional regulator C-terminal domain-containing protein [Chenggangzhangella methanolivorans]